MIKNVLNVRNQLDQFSVKNQLIASSLLIALVTPFFTPVSTHATHPPISTQAQAASDTKSVSDQLLGQWRTKDPESGKPITFIFAPEEKFYMVFTSPEGSLVALEINYLIDPTPKPMQLDLVFSSLESILTVFEFTDEQKLRVELEGLTAGKPRPNGLTAKATIMEKISEETTLPKDVQVISLETEK